MASDASRSKTGINSPSSACGDAELSSGSAATSPAQADSRQRVSNSRGPDRSDIGCCSTKHSKFEGSRRRQAKSPGASTAAAGVSQVLDRRGSRANSVAFLPDDSAPCVAASTVSRVPSPSADTCRYKRGSLGLKGFNEASEAPQNQMEEHILSPPGGGQLVSTAATASLRVSHRNWQSNCTLLYKHIMSHILEWPSLSLQWLHSCNP